jgi:hypothetical protein
MKGWTYLGDDDINGSDGTDTSRCRTSVGFQTLTDLSKITVGEDESHISTAAIDKLFDRASRVFLDVFLDTLAHHGVLSHKNFTLSTKSNTGSLDLVGTDVVNFDDEHLGISPQVLLELCEVLGLSFSGKRHLRLSFQSFKKGKKLRALNV